MLVALSIRDIVLIDRLDLSFTAGLSVLTGETGAGKSILLDSLALALGGRGDAGLVRTGADHGQVIAAFDVALTHPVRDILLQAGVDTAAEDVVLRRVQMSDGRTKAYINQQPVAAQLLRSVGALLVEIHGQHADRALVDPLMHRQLVDAYGGHGGLMRQVREAWRFWRALVKAHEEQVERLAAVRKEADFLRHAAAELDKLHPQVGEEEQLSSFRQQMMAAEKIAGDLRDAYQELDGAASPIPSLSSLQRRLERKSALLPQLMEGVVASLSTALDVLEDARANLETALRATNFDPKELERTEERLFALRAAARKYMVRIDELPHLLVKFSDDLQALDQGEGRLLRLESEASAAQAAYTALAADLSAARRAAAAQLDAAVMRELPPLKLERARFISQIDTAPSLAGADGCDSVTFFVQTNPGTAAGAMMKVASGGELARFILALKVVLADAGSAPTLVFDEIDTGVGGAVADAIGSRLAQLAANVQVLCVTHAPQVAARAQGHFKISKEDVAQDRVATRVMLMDAAARVEEIARMLSGAQVTSEARAQATRLLGV